MTNDKISKIDSYEQFVLWELASQDSIEVKRVYVDIAGDLVAGVLLSQIIFWHLPNKEGCCKLRVEHDGFLWLAKKRQDWWDECRVSAKQFDRACTALQKKGLLIAKTFKFQGSPTKHIRLCWESFLKLLGKQILNAYKPQKNEVKKADNSLKVPDITERVKSILPFGEDGNTPNGKNHIHRLQQRLQTEKNTHGENENLPKKSMCVLEELNDSEKAAWEWAQNHDFWKGRITTLKQLKSNLANDKPFRVQFEQTRSIIKPVNGKKVKLKETGKRIKIDDCPYCNERGVIEWRGRLRMDTLPCPHNHEEIKQLALKKEATIGTAKPGYEDPAGLKKPKITPQKKRGHGKN